ncbi:MAG: serine hydrolase [Rhodothermales bacterium]|nr:serine hydrolase [Rhodothermales bacterium]
MLLLLVAILFTGSHSLDPVKNGLPRSTPEAQGISSEAILAFVEAASDEIDTMNSFMLVRHGHVVAEGWWTPYDAATPHVLYSLSKSFTSTAVGLAIAEGHFSLNDRVLDFFPDDAPADPSDNLKAMRVHDLLRMSAGHDVEVALQSETNWVKAFLAHPVPHLPGTHFTYNTPATFMLSAIVQQTTGQTVFDYLQPRLFAPLDIENHSWGQNPQGITLGGYGLNVRTEDIAKFGQLYLQQGMWDGKQLIPADWVAAATALQTSNGSNPDSDWNQGYGYQFWRSRHDTYRGDGAFGQYMMVIPEHDAVIAITSGVRDMQQVMNLVWDKLLPALESEALRESPAAQAALTARLANLSVKPAEGEATSKLARRVSGKRFEFPENEQGVQALAFDFRSKTPALTITTQAGESRIPFGLGDWAIGSTLFANGVEHFWGMSGVAHASGASGGWISEDTFSLKLVLYETPFYSSLTFRFAGDDVTFSGEHNVAFGSRETPSLIGAAN